MNEITSKNYEPTIVSADFEIGGVWGNSIRWSEPKKFEKQPITSESRFSCHGRKRIKPEIGQTLKAEFVYSWMVFEFVKVKSFNDPPDMFWAVVKPIQQLIKK